jgi:hypothetical protein
MHGLLSEDAPVAMFLALAAVLGVRLGFGRVVVSETEPPNH